MYWTYVINMKWLNNNEISKVFYVWGLYTIGGQMELSENIYLTTLEPERH